MNMVEEWVVTLGFNKENLRNFPTPLGEQLRSQPTKATPPKAKGAKFDSGGGSTSYLIKQGGEDKCWRCGGSHKKKQIPIHHRPQLPTLILAIHVPIIMHMNKMPIIVLHFI
jgi:hypothetical protein